MPTHSDGSISIANTSHGATGVLLDIVGWANTGVARTAGAFEPRFPDRVASGLQLASGQTRAVRIAGQAGVPLAHVGAVLASVTASSAKRAGSLQFGNTGTSSARGDVDFAPGTKPSDLVEVPLVNGALLVHNTSRGAVTIAVDVVGFVPNVTLAPPAMSISRYLGDLTEDVSHDQTVMDTHGCDDATAMRHCAHPFVLLDVGAQSVTGPELSPAHPGVSLTQSLRHDRAARYARPRVVLDSYLAGFSRCATASPPTIAIGTSNDGDVGATARTTTAPARPGQGLGRVGRQHARLRSPA